MRTKTNKKPPIKKMSMTIFGKKIHGRFSEKVEFYCAFQTYLKYTMDATARESLGCIVANSPKQQKEYNYSAEEMDEIKATWSPLVKTHNFPILTKHNAKFDPNPTFWGMIKKAFKILFNR